MKREPNKDFVFQGEKIAVFDEVWVEEAWEDEAGALHDEPANKAKLGGHEKQPCGHPVACISSTLNALFRGKRGRRDRTPT